MQLFPLRNGCLVYKSNSVAHLVENEAPLSTTGNVSILSGGAGGGLEDTTTTTVLLDEDGMELETRGMGGGPSMDDSSNQLTGSYTNLFRDSMSNGVANGPSGGGQPGKPNNSYHHHSSMMMSECDKIQSADEIINVSELMMVCSVSGHENVYSNVPPAQISPSGSAVGLLASPKRASVGSSNVSGVVDVSSSTVGPGGYQHLALDDPSQLLSSTFISNDLDLDDPVLSSSFATATKSTANTMTKLHPPPAPSSAAGGPMVAAQQQHLKQPQAMITTIEMKNVIKTLDPNVIIQQQASSNGSSGTTAAVSSSANVIDSNGGSASMHNNTTTTNNNNNNSHTESPMFISPSASRMRLLQESTMIDTALDLDSLDGSIGNHSQSCLVKTAIV
uniref:Uncharacterized protein n=1 Tax=Anopheles coluzzii TaxID=1518534 RepID=A0A8W7PPX5_ANOCL